MKKVFDYEIYGEKNEIKEYILLSTSPRRKELLSFLNPKVLPVEVDERKIEKKYLEKYKSDDFLERAAKTCCEISKAKADIELKTGALYISADSIIISENKIFNKPENYAEAKKMLQSYFGKKHFAVTSVCLSMIDYREVFYTIAEVEFVDYYDALDEAINDYIQKYRPLDKAGGYSIKDIDPRFVKSINGDINTILGLPVAEISTRLFSNGN